MKNKWLLFLIIPLSAFADQLIVSNIPNGCLSGFNNDTYILATFARNQYQCNSGYYVPANNDGCVVCPDVYDCSGGTFTFDENLDQGNKFKSQVTENIRNGCKTDFLRAFNNVANITATFTPNVHNCNPGYYLPANTDSCTICPAGNKCIGGTWTFNETTPQGIEPCPASAPHAPAGSAVCYPHILHLSNEIPNDIIYLKSTKTTTPALNVDMDNDGVADVFANMTTTRTTMTSASEHYLKILVDGVEYYVCDDTTLR